MRSIAAPIVLGIVLAPALPQALPAAAAPEAAAGGEEVVRRFTFRSPADLAGWEAGAGVSELRVEGARLRGKLTAPDAYLYSPPLAAELDGLAVRVRWSCPRGGNGQCYFATRKSPHMGEDRVVSHDAAGGGMVETEFVLGPGGGEGRAGGEGRGGEGRGGGAGELIRFRLDPFNGNQDVPFEIEEVALVYLPARLEAAFAPARSAAAIGEPVPFRLSVRRLAGRRPRGAMEAVVSAAGRPDISRRLDLDAEAPQAEAKLTFDRPGVHAARAVLRSDGRVTHDLEARVAVGLGPAPVKIHFAAGGQAIELLPASLPAGSASLPAGKAAVPEGKFAGARIWAREGETWREAGLLLPLAEAVIEDGGRTRRHLPALSLEQQGGRGLELAGSGPSGLSFEVGFSSRAASGPFARSATAAAVELLEVRARLKGPAGTKVRRFGGPSVRRLPRGGGLLDRFALFGGLEILEPGWSSSSARAVGPRYAKRWTPHPYQVSLPVMAVEAEGVTTALYWDPLQTWAEGRRLPAATFASPNAPESQDEHRLDLSVPSVGDDRPENEALASRPFRLDGRLLEIGFVLEAALNRPVLGCARRWYETFGVSPAPPAPRSDRDTYGLLARSLGQTMYWKEERGWRGHWFIEKSSHRRPDFAAELVLHARTTGDRRWVEATGLDSAKPAIEVRGFLWDQARAGAGAADAAVRAMGDDGTYAYHDSPAAREATRKSSGGFSDTLGEDGSTSLGTCVQGALPLLRHAAWTGEARWREPVEKALRALRRFRVPRGAQVWEVHQDIPDIRASALAVECFRLGYLVTGEPAYLDEASYWAEAGLPFLFSWRVPLAGPANVRTSRARDDASQAGALPAKELFEHPNRQVTPYGTIPVFGTSFYVVSWFGVLVQWCGLEWAAKVLELCELKDDPLLRTAAEGVVRSGLQQMFDRDPWTGLYPDVWDLRGNWAGGALISPKLIIDALRAGGHLPQTLRTWSRRVGGAPGAKIVHGWGEPIACAEGADGLRVHVRLEAGELGELVITGCRRPKSVETDGARMLDGEDRVRFDEPRGLLGIRFRADSAEPRIHIRWD